MTRTTRRRPTRPLIVFSTGDSDPTGSSHGCPLFTGGSDTSSLPPSPSSQSAPSLSSFSPLQRIVSSPTYPPVDLKASSPPTSLLHPKAQSPVSSPVQSKASSASYSPLQQHTSSLVSMCDSKNNTPSSIRSNAPTVLVVPPSDSNAAVYSTGAMSCDSASLGVRCEISTVKDNTSVQHSSSSYEDLSSIAVWQRSPYESFDFDDELYGAPIYNANLTYSDRIIRSSSSSPASIDECDEHTPAVNIVPSPNHRTSGDVSLSRNGNVHHEAGDISSSTDDKDLFPIQTTYATYQPSSLSLRRRETDSVDLAAMSVGQSVATSDDVNDDSTGPSETTSDEADAKVTAPSETTNVEMVAKVTGASESTSDGVVAKITGPSETTTDHVVAKRTEASDTARDDVDYTVIGPSETKSDQPDATVIGPSETTCDQPEAKVIGPRETTCDQPDAKVIGPIETTCDQPDAKVIGSSETTSDQPDANVMGPSETTSDQPDAKVIGPIETTCDQPDAKVIGPSETTCEQPDANVIGPSETTCDQPDAKVVGPSETTSDQPDAKVIGPSETTCDQPDAKVIGPSETTSDQADAKVVGPSETTCDQPDATVIGPSETTCDQPDATVIGPSETICDQPDAKFIGPSETTCDQPDASVIGPSETTSEQPDANVIWPSETTSEQPDAKVIGPSETTSEQPDVKVIGPSETTCDQPDASVIGPSETTSEQPDANVIWPSETTSEQPDAKVIGPSETTSDQPDAKVIGPSETTSDQPDATVIGPSETTSDQPDVKVIGPSETTSEQPDAKVIGPSETTSEQPDTKAIGPSETTSDQPDVKVIGPSETTSEQPDAKVIGPSETTSEQPDTKAIGPSETTSDQPDAKVIGPSETTCDQLDATVIGPSETTCDQPDATVIEPSETTSDQPDVKVIGPSETASDQPDAKVIGPSETTSDQPDATVIGPSETTSDQPDAKVIGPSETTCDQPDATVIGPSETTSYETDAKVIGPSETTNDQPDATVIGPSETTSDQPDAKDTRPSEITSDDVVATVTGPSETTCDDVVSVVTGPSHTTSDSVIGNITGPCETPSDEVTELSGKTNDDVATQSALVDTFDTSQVDKNTANLTQSPIINTSIVGNNPAIATLLSLNDTPKADIEKSNEVQSSTQSQSLLYNTSTFDNDTPVVNHSSATITGRKSVISSSDRLGGSEGSTSQSFKTSDKSTSPFPPKEDMAMHPFTDTTHEQPLLVQGDTNRLFMVYVTQPETPEVVFIVTCPNRRRSPENITPTGIVSQEITTSTKLPLITNMPLCRDETNIPHECGVGAGGDATAGTCNMKVSKNTLDKGTTSPKRPQHLSLDLSKTMPTRHKTDCTNIEEREPRSQCARPRVVASSLGSFAASSPVTAPASSGPPPTFPFRRPTQCDMPGIEQLVSAPQSLPHLLPSPDLSVVSFPETTDGLYWARRSPLLAYSPMYPRKRINMGTRSLTDLLGKESTMAPSLSICPGGRPHGIGSRSSSTSSTGSGLSVGDSRSKHHVGIRTTPTGREPHRYTSGQNTHASGVVSNALRRLQFFASPPSLPVAAVSPLPPPCHPYDETPSPGSTPVVTPLGSIASMASFGWAEHVPSLSSLHEEHSLENRHQSSATTTHGDHRSGVSMHQLRPQFIEPTHPPVLNTPPSKTSTSGPFARAGQRLMRGVSKIPEEPVLPPHNKKQTTDKTQDGDFPSGRPPPTNAKGGTLTSIKSDASDTFEDARDFVTNVTQHSERVDNEAKSRAGAQFRREKIAERKATAKTGKHKDGKKCVIM